MLIKQNSTSKNLANLHIFYKGNKKLPQKIKILRQFAKTQAPIAISLQPKTMTIINIALNLQNDTNKR